MHALYFHARRDVIRYTAPRTQRFIKHFLPVVFITLINMVTYLLNYDEYMARITICIGTLTALVSALHNIYIYKYIFMLYLVFGNAVDASARALLTVVAMRLGSL